MRAEPLLDEIGEAVSVAVLEAVPDPVVVAVRVPRRAGGPELGDVPQPVSVGVLALVGDPVAVGVETPRMRSGGLLLEVRQAVAVGVLASVAKAVPVRVPAPGMRPGQVLVAVPQAVAVGVLHRVDEAITVRVPAERAGEGPLPLEPVRKAVVVGVDRDRRCGRHRRQARDDEQHGGTPRHPSASTDQSPHGRPRMDGRGHLSSDARRPRPCPQIWPLGARSVHHPSVIGPVRADTRTARAAYGRTASIRSRIRRLTPSTGTRSWVIVSRSRMVTAPSSSESTSTVTHHGVPISSWRR